MLLSDCNEPRSDWAAAELSKVRCTMADRHKESARFSARFPMRAAALALAGAASLVAPAPAGAQVPTHDSLIGSGPNLNVSITSGPSGEKPTGSLTADVFGTRFQTTGISCFVVSGNTATFAAPVAPNALGVTFIKVTFVDNGAAGSGLDTVAFSGFIVPFDCASPLGPGNPILGDVVVVDAPPLPSSKEQCKDDTWQGFGVFENQGDCVSFVTTRGENSPAGG